MPCVRRSSSSALAILAVALLPSITGCNGASVADLADASVVAPPKMQKETAPAASVDAATVEKGGTPLPAQKPASRVAVAEPANPGIDSSIKTAAYSSDAKTGADRAWCRYLDARAEAKNAILLSPTLSGSFDDDSSATVKVSYDLLDFKRAQLERQSAQASCDRYVSSTRISQMMFIVPQQLTYAGNLEKANYLGSKRGELESLKNRIRRHVDSGEMTAQLAAGLVQYIETIRSLEHHARAEAHRRETLGVLDPGSMQGLDTQLTNSERALQQVDRQLRSLEAMSVTVAAGVNRRDGQDGAFFNDQSTYARVSFSYRLGAASPRRHHYEDLAEQARIDALTEPGLGVLWRTSELASALKRAREGLVVQRDAINAAIAEARSNAAKFSEGYEIDLYQSKYRAQVDVIKLTADLRGIEATLSDIDKVEKKLRFQ